MYQQECLQPSQGFSASRLSSYDLPCNRLAAVILLQALVLEGVLGIRLIRQPPPRRGL
jgi:hypothetical protein